MRNPFRRKREPETGEVLEEGAVEFGYAEPTHEEAETAYRQQVRGELEDKEAERKAREEYLKELHEEQAKAEAERKAKESVERAERLSRLKEEAEVAKTEAEIRGLKEPSLAGKVAGAAKAVAKEGAETVGWVAKGFTGRGVRVGKKGEKGERAEGGGRRLQRAMMKVATAGGKVRVSKSRRHLYVPEAEEKLYVPQRAVRQLTTPELRKLRQPITVKPSARPTAPKPAEPTTFGRLRQAGGLGQSRIGQFATSTGIEALGKSRIAQLATGRAKPAEERGLAGMIGANLSSQNRAMARLRQLSAPRGVVVPTIPRGLTSNEAMAYTGLREANADIDTKSQVVKELMDRGMSRAEAIEAVDGLLRKGIIRTGRMANGEPVLEIAR